MTATVVWHHDVNLSDGTPYPLRHQLSAYARSQPLLNDDLLGLTPDQSRTSTAVHELGHAVLFLAGGLRVAEV
ncbi:hypothetical protein KBZ21_43415, partial [Streptomyces sp. A73]|nr:hypothetical protein [Streptomyces sp. A73]